MNSENQSTPWGGYSSHYTPAGRGTGFVLIYNKYNGTQLLEMGPNRIREKGDKLEPEKRKALRNNSYMLGMRKEKL